MLILHKEKINETLCPMDAIPRPVRSGRRRPWRARGAGIIQIGSGIGAEGAVLHSNNGDRGVVAVARPIWCVGAPQERGEAGEEVVEGLVWE